MSLLKSPTHTFLAPAKDLCSLWHTSAHAVHDDTQTSAKQAVQRSASRCDQLQKSQLSTLNSQVFSWPQLSKVRGAQGAIDGDRQVVKDT